MDFNRVNSWTYLLFFLSIIFFVTRGELVRLDDIEKVYKKRRHDKDSRLTTVLVNEGHLSTLFFFFLFDIGVRVCVSCNPTNQREELPLNTWCWCRSKTICYRCRKDGLTVKSQRGNPNVRIPTPAQRIERKAKRRTSWCWNRRPKGN